MSKSHLKKYSKFLGTSYSSIDRSFDADALNNKRKVQSVFSKIKSVMNIDPEFEVLVIPDIELARELWASKDLIIFSSRDFIKDAVVPLVWFAAASKDTLSSLEPLLLGGGSNKFVVGTPLLNQLVFISILLDVKDLDA